MPLRRRAGRRIRDEGPAELPPIRVFPPPRRPRRRFAGRSRPERDHEERPPSWIPWDPEPPVWWPDDAEGWARAVERSGWKTPIAEVEFDGLVVGCDLQGSVVRADVLDPVESRSHRMLGRREAVGALGTLLAVVVAMHLTRNGYRYALPLSAFWMLGLGYLGLRDERTSVRLPVGETSAAVARHGAIRTLAERRDLTARLRDFPDRSHRILWRLATAAGPDDADAARAEHLALHAQAVRAAAHDGPATAGSGG